MQIYFLDEDPVVAARYLPDRLVGKMAVESLQLLSTAHHILGLPIPVKKDGTPYKAVKQAKELVYWLCSSWGNRAWLIHHALACTQEHTKRYGTVHTCNKVLQEMVIEEKGDVTPFPRRWMKGAPIEVLNDIEQVVEAYRVYLRWKVQEKPNVFTWKDRRPLWLDHY